MARHIASRALLRLDDLLFQDNARIRLGVLTFTTMSQAWHCTCGQLIDGGDVAYAVGCRSLNSLIIAGHDETADALQYAGRLGFSSSRDVPHMRRGSRTTNRPRARWDFHCHIRPGLGHVLGDVSFIHLGFLVVSPFRIACVFLHVERGRSSKRVWRSHRIIYFIYPPSRSQLCASLRPASW
jgi:hypothetical protein